MGPREPFLLRAQCNSVNRARFDRERACGLPVVVVTASTARQEVEAAIVAGAAAFVQKPRSGESIAHFVSRVAKPGASMSLVPSAEVGGS